MSGKAKIPQGSFKGLCDNKEFHTMHGCAIAMEMPPLSDSNEDEGRDGEKKKKKKTKTYLTTGQAGNVQVSVMLNRPGHHSKHKESCLERVCGLKEASLSGVS